MKNLKINWKSKAIYVSFIFILILLLIFMLENGETEHISYSKFYEDVTVNKIKEVEINDDSVVFKYNGDNKKYYTDNPSYDGFKEFLLLNNVTVNDTFGMSSVYSFFDVILYLVFIGVTIFALYKIISFSHKDFKIIHNTNTTFSDIVGMTDLKNEMMKIVDIVKEPEKYKAKGIRAPKGIILEGPPGNGKTLLARAIASEAKMNFIATKGADFQSAMMSIGPRKIKMLFKRARRNKPCIIFIDEFDGIGERRNYAGTGIDKENNRLITVMLNEMDGFESGDGVLVIAATNSYASLDAALIRPGRFDIKYRIDNPDKESVIKLIEMYTKNKKLDDKIKIPEIAKCFGNLSASAIETVLNEATILSDIKGRDKITIYDIAEAGKKTGTVKIITE